MSVQRILFVCTGNTCRSPMAEGLFHVLTKSRQGNWEARSAGVSTNGGSPVSQHAATVLSRKGGVDKRRSDSLKADWVEWADLILTMTGSHKQAVLSRFPEAVDKVFTLKEFVMDDPGLMRLLSERGELMSELLVKQALMERIEEQELDRLEELERQLPSMDIQDPFGGSLMEYEACAEEIESALRKLIEKLDSMR